MKTKDVKMYKEYMYKNQNTIPILITVGGTKRGGLKSSSYPDSYYHPATYSERRYIVTDGKYSFRVRAKWLSIIPLMCINK